MGIPLSRRLVALTLPATIGVVRRNLLPSDEQLHTQLRGAPELSDGIESLNYWQARRQELSWYQIRARREAATMARRWEERVRATVLSHPSLPIAARVSGGVLVARTGLRRWQRRVAIGARLTVGAALLVVAVPLVALAIHFA
jgi:hypothetical protein